jgi:ferric-dicitrate binding protein FerR (iron transport regulator)
MSYAERIRHPDGALDVPRETERRRTSRIGWILLALIVAAVLAWRAGWFGKVAATGARAATAVANPHGWV